MQRIAWFALVILLGLVVATPTAAQNVTCTDSKCKGPASELINFLYLRNTGDIGIEVSEHPDQTVLLDCTLWSGRYLMLRQEHLLFQETYAALVTAMNTGQQLTIKIVTGSETCDISYVLMWSPPEVVALHSPALRPTAAEDDTVFGELGSTVTTDYDSR